MKLLFASDIHGSAYWCARLLERYQAESPHRLVLLGDLLYHGPRNDLPRDYNPKQVFAMLNPLKGAITAVRGNCDSEVDQMVLDFPMMADYLPLLVEGKTLFCTHGHLFSPDALPPLQPGDVLLSGHTHLFGDCMVNGIRCLNTGSVALPKENRPCSYLLYDNGEFTIKDMDGTPLKLI
ncbi:MAG: phosphodiesterase [Angelakisella sp.]